MDMKKNIDPICPEKRWAKMLNSKQILNPKKFGKKILGPANSAISS